MLSPGEAGASAKGAAWVVQQAWRGASHSSRHEMRGRVGLEGRTRRRRGGWRLDGGDWLGSTIGNNC